MAGSVAVAMTEAAGLAAGLAERAGKTGTCTRTPPPVPALLRMML